MKVCARCRVEKKLDEFYRSKRNGHQAYCKSCRYNYRQENRDQDKQHKLKHRYGLTAADLAILIDDQEGLCAICSHEWQVVDHDHETGEIRGLLCNTCNLAIGFLYDDVELVANAKAYWR